MLSSGSTTSTSTMSPRVGCILLVLSDENDLDMFKEHTFRIYILALCEFILKRIMNAGQLRLCPVSDPAAGWRGGVRNMKSMWLPLVAIFFMTYFYRARGPWPPWPPGSATHAFELSFWHKIRNRKTVVGQSREWKSPGYHHQRNLHGSGAA